MAAKAAKQKPAKLSPKAQEAVDKLTRVEDALLTVQATIGGYVREVQDVKAMFTPTEEGKG